MRARLRRLAAVGLAAGCVEFAVRASPSLGLSLLEQLTFLTLACVAGALVALPGALSSRRSLGVGVGVVCAVHVCVAWRLGPAVNLPLSSLRVLSTLIVLSLGSLVACAALDSVFRRVERWLLPIGATAAALGLLLGRPFPVLPAQGPNLLLVTLDTVRADRLQPYGGALETPALQRLADEGVLFEQAIATAPLTEPSHLSILTGLRTRTTGVMANGTPLGEQPGLVSLRLQEAGFRTGAVVSGFPLHSRWGWDQGFDVYDDDFGRVTGLHRLSLVQAFDQLLLRTNLRERPGDGALRRARTFLRRNRKGRFFLWLHLFDPHAPYERFDVSSAPTDGEALALPAWWPPEHRAVTDTDWLVRAYEAELQHTDQLLGQLLEELPEDTLVVVVADHGESLTEHGYLFEHGDHLYDPSLRVPLLAWWPEQLPAGERVPCQVSTVDIVPTLVELLDLREMAHDGRSLTGLLDSCVDQPAVATTLGARYVPDPPVHTAVRIPDLKIIDEGEETLVFDLVEDPGELRPLEDSERIDKASELFDAVVNKPASVRPVQLDPGSEELLRALGYLD